MTSIIVAFPKIEDAKKIKGLLIKNGFDVQGTASSGASVIGMANELDRGIVVCGYKFKDMVYHEINGYLPKEFQLLLVASKQLLSQCGGDSVASLSLPLKIHELIQTLSAMIEEIEQEQRRIRRRAGRVREERELLNKAKLVLMERKGLTEEEAHRYIQKTSMDAGRSMTESAQMLLSMLAE